jgi:2-C-methyl-D-erythritol 4-phosphate cytidylyltransferase
MIWGAVIVAAGRGTRFGRPKQLVELAGRPMLAWSIATFDAMPEIGELAIVTEPEFIDAVEALARPLVRHAALRVVAGGADRQTSVRHGIEALGDEVGAILVHDGARPLIRPVDVRAGMRPVRPGTATLLGARVVDTIKVAAADGTVVRTLDRSELWSAQTPQFATARDLRRAHADAARSGDPPATDDAALLERAGLEVVIVESSPDNFKVTLPGDLARAEMLLAPRASDGTFDAHELEAAP